MEISKTEQTVMARYIFIDKAGRVVQYLDKNIVVDGNELPTVSPIIRLPDVLPDPDLEEKWCETGITYMVKFRQFSLLWSENIPKSGVLRLIYIEE